MSFRKYCAVAVLVSAFAWLGYETLGYSGPRLTEKQQRGLELINALKNAYFYESYEVDHELIVRLLEAGADLSVGDPKEGITSGNTALMWAVLVGDEKAVELLLNAGADVNLQNNKRGRTALIWSVWRDRKIQQRSTLLLPR